MTNVAVRMIAAKTRESVPVDNPLCAYFVSRIAILVRILTIVGRSDGRIARSVSACSCAGKDARQNNEREFPMIDTHATVLVHFEVGGRIKNRRAAKQQRADLLSPHRGLALIRWAKQIQTTSRPATYRPPALHSHRRHRGTP